MTRLVVGLGNPGPEYEATRHNAGFMTIDLLGEQLGAAYWHDEAGSQTAVVRIGESDVILAKPLTFVNKSGRAVCRLAEEYGVGAEDIVVVHDDIDLPAGAVRAKSGGGHGGHNGVRSIVEDLDEDAFTRVRIGVGRPPGRQDPADYVLEPVRSERLEELEAMLPTAAQCVMHVLEHGVESAMREFNAD